MEYFKFAHLKDSKFRGTVSRGPHACGTPSDAAAAGRCASSSATPTAKRSFGVCGFKTAE
jgi:hypothetical protein